MNTTTLDGSRRAVIHRALPRSAKPSHRGYTMSSIALGGGEAPIIAGGETMQWPLGIVSFGLLAAVGIATRWKHLSIISPH